ncbi:hypothetical protein ELH42_05130 [Rhizobium ruizarguesonis]|nr:hypothetical protein ELH85_05965 [Rhizobium ruizarguesonis]TCA64681.1 hypothetical protein E0H62_32875 [Rhizobium leguminosarum bv. viciae]TAZ77515.1 hypothetical protein ELH68_06940 [Rhizobium ruizarguesonis]TBA03890.1 hypothetical protein ELH64_05490 [Rhizobium ruizarguesonis]TBA25302.1 hypothetical protein ELH61_05640 [Rhizobium ruizarguesonis]
MSRNGLWSALQTHLQGVDGTTLAIKPKIILHCVILLSQKLARSNNIARKKRQGRCRHWHNQPPLREVGECRAEA